MKNEVNKRLHIVGYFSIQQFLIRSSMETYFTKSLGLIPRLSTAVPKAYFKVFPKTSYDLFL